MSNRSAVKIQRNEALGEAIWKYGCGSRAERVHAHAEHSVAFVVRGRTRARIGSTPVDLREGACIFIPAGTPHLCAPVDPARFVYHVVYAHESVAAAFARCNVSDDSVVVGRAQPSVAADLHSLFSSASVRETAERELREILAKCFAEREESYGPFRSILPRIAPHPPVTDDEPGSRYRLFRWYKRRYAIGVHGYMQNARIEASKILLRRGVSVAHAAAECDFFDQSHFARTFRLYTGMAPSAYRNGR